MLAHGEGMDGLGQYNLISHKCFCIIFKFTCVHLYELTKSSKYAKKSHIKHYAETEECSKKIR